MRRKEILVPALVVLNACLLALVVWQGEPQVAEGKPGAVGQMRGLAHRIDNLEGSVAANEALVIDIDSRFTNAVGISYTNELSLPSRVGGLEDFNAVVTDTLDLLQEQVFGTITVTHVLGQQLGNLTVAFTDTISLVNFQATRIISLTNSLGLLEQEVQFLRQCCEIVE